MSNPPVGVHEFEATLIGWFQGKLCRKRISLIMFDKKNEGFLWTSPEKHGTSSQGHTSLYEPPLSLIVSTSASTPLQRQRVVPPVDPDEPTDGEEIGDLGVNKIAKLQNTPRNPQMNPSTSKRIGDLGVQKTNSQSRCSANLAAGAFAARNAHLPHNSAHSKAAVTVSSGSFGATDIPWSRKPLIHLP